MAEEGASNASNKKRKIETDINIDDSKKRKIGTDINIADSEFALFDELPDDLVVNIASKLAAIASCPADLFSLRLTCKRLNKLGLDRTVLSKLRSKAFLCKAKDWNPEAQDFLRKVSKSMNLEAIYALGMIRFYIHKDYKLGKAIIEFAAKEKRRHRHAMFTMYVIHFYGSGGTRGDQNLKSSLDNLIGAALIGHADAIRELGYCLYDGHIVPRNIEEGRRLLLQATAREVVSRVRPDAANAGRGRISIPVPVTPWLAKGRWLTSVPRGPRLASSVNESSLHLMTDFGWDIPDAVPHPVHRFLSEWFEIRGGQRRRNGLRVCARAMCGRAETRLGEFFYCRICRVPRYCSQACQIMDWKSRHQQECLTPVIVDGDGEENDENALDEIGEGGEEEGVNEEGANEEEDGKEGDLEN